MSRIRAASVLIALAAIVVTVGAPAAEAKRVSLHFFSRLVHTRISDAHGKAVPRNARLAVGDRITRASDDYVGNDRHHAARPTASDYIECTVTSRRSVLCSGVLAIGGSMILNEDFMVGSGARGPLVVRITGGTGRYRRARGKVTATVAGKNLNLTITATTT
jgi:hypothetical protein